MYTASGADTLAAIRIPDPGMESFYRGLMSVLLSKLGRTQPSPDLPSIIRAMVWDFAARTANPADMTLWFGCDSAIAAAAPLLSSGTPSLEETNVCIVFRGYAEFKRQADVWPIPLDPEEGFARQQAAWSRLRTTGGLLYSVAYSAAVPVDLIATSFRCLVDASDPPHLLLLDTFSPLDTSALDEFHFQGWRTELIADRAFPVGQMGERWRLVVLRFTEV